MIDRAAHLRTRDAEREALLPRALVLLVWRGKSPVERTADSNASAIALFPSEEIPDLVQSAEQRVFLGMRGEDPLFAIDLPRGATHELPRGAFADARTAGPTLSPSDFGLLGYARGMMHWHRETRHCGRCGEATSSAQGGFARVCASCERTTYPRTDPAVMILVTRGDRCLLARQPRFPQGMYSALAGFVEPGEDLEGCVIRETHEEVGLAIDRVRYFRSDPWPFPASLMLGFFAEARSEKITLDRDELEEARWFTRDELRSPNGFFYPPAYSLAHHLIGSFLARPGD